jgi:hypothetical protein
MANKPNNPSLWSRAKSLAKQKFDVYPSAYANGWAAKYYKSKGGTWRKGEQGMYMEDGGKVSIKAGGENHVVYKKQTKQGEGKPGHIMVNHPTMDKGKWDTIDLTEMNNKINTVSKGVTATKKWHKENPYPKKKMQVGGMTGFTPQTSAGTEVVKNAIAMTYMKEGGKMPSEIARARFMAAAGGNESEAKSMGTKYGYKFQKAGVKRPPASMRAAIAEGKQVQQMRQTMSNPQAQQRIAQYKLEVAKKNEVARQKAIAGQQKRQAIEDAQENAAIKARIDQSVKAQGKDYRTETQAIGDKARLFGPYSPLTTSGLVKADPNSFFDNYLNPVKFIGDMASGLGAGVADIIEQGVYTADYSNLLKGIATPVAAGATMGVLKGPMHTLEKNIATKTKNVLGNTLGNTSISAAVPATLAIRGVVNTGAKTGIKAAEHDIVYKTTSPLSNKKYAKGGIKEMYYMKKGGQFPDRYKKMGFSGVNQPKRTPGASKSHAVVTKVGGDYKLIRFGQQGVSGSPKKAGESAAYAARRRSFKARHAKNIAKGKSSAAYWANRVKW